MAFPLAPPLSPPILLFFFIGFKDDPFRVVGLPILAHSHSHPAELAWLGGWFIGAAYLAAPLPAPMISLSLAAPGGSPAAAHLQQQGSRPSSRQAHFAPDAYDAAAVGPLNATNARNRAEVLASFADRER